ncbi:MAG TPA: hypothetical protein VNI78_07260 [Vicinamibacterales bacterium]|nr:hypothetical protein [Vicinamibacterales bacterium]
MLTIPVPLALGRFKRLPQRTTEVWQGGIFKLPAWIENPDDPDLAVGACALAVSHARRRARSRKR